MSRQLNQRAIAHADEGQTDVSVVALGRPAQPLTTVVDRVVEPGQEILADDAVDPGLVLAELGDGNDGRHQAFHAGLPDRHVLQSHDQTHVDSGRRRDANLRDDGKGETIRQSVADRGVTRSRVEQEYPQDSFFKASWLPMVHAAVAIRRGDPARAVELLQGAGRVELGTNAALWPAYLRGLAYLDQGAGNEARAELQKILDHKGVIAPKDFNPAAMTLYPLAHLGRARAGARTGDVAERRKSYEALLALWKDADPDIPILRAARREYRMIAE